MLSRILTILQKDLRAGWRESLVTFLLLGPFMLAFLSRLVIPLVERGQPASEGRPPVVPMAAALLCFCVLLTSGLVVGLLVVDEKESGMVRAYAVTPLRFSEYLLAKLIEAVSLGSVLSLGATLFLTGLSVAAGRLVLSMLASVPIGLTLGILVGALAKDQLGAMVLLKGLLFFFTSVPVAGFVLKGKAALWLAPFPNHWAVQAIFAALTSAPMAKSAALAFGLGSVALAASVRLLRRRLGLGAAGGPVEASSEQPAPIGP